MLWLLLIVFIILVVIFGILGFVVHHLFLIAFVIAILFVIGHLGFLSRR